MAGARLGVVVAAGGKGPAQRMGPVGQDVDRVVGHRGERGFSDILGRLQGLVGGGKYRRQDAVGDRRLVFHAPARGPCQPAVQVLQCALLAGPGPEREQAPVVGFQRRPVALYGKGEDLGRQFQARRRGKGRVGDQSRRDRRAVDPGNRLALLRIAFWNAAHDVEQRQDLPRPYLARERHAGKGLSSMAAMRRASTGRALALPSM